MQPTPTSTIGFAPSIAITETNPERRKYRELWANHAAYRAYSPGEGRASEFLNQARPKAGETVIDFGCGTGRASFVLGLFGMRTILVDFCDNALDPEVKQALTTQHGVITFVEADLTRPLPETLVAKYGFCCDVLEHVPPDKVKNTLRHILTASQHVFLSVATGPDDYGPQLLGTPLHMTVRPFSWWRDLLIDLGAVIHWSREDASAQAATFYVSAWTSGTEFMKCGGMNATDEELRKNIRHSLGLSIPMVIPYNLQDVDVMLLAGGPSLSDHFELIRDGRAAGKKLVTVNGTYGWAIEHGLQPSAQVMVDSRAFNSRFVQPTVATCKYLLASQCHPDTFAAAPASQTWLWHSAIDEAMRKELDEHYAKQGVAWFPILGGSTVVLRALTLLRVLGFKRIEIFGFDSCVREDQHHAYKQAENDGERIASVTCGGRVFRCTGWMVSQAQEFMDQIKIMGDELELIVHGDGLIAHIINTGAAADFSLE